LALLAARKPENLMHKAEDIATRYLGTPLHELGSAARHVAHKVAARQAVARNLPKEMDATPSFGQRAADAVARFGGSWTFVMLFAAALVAWVGINAVLLHSQGATFDPYPYILLNLFLSMLAAVQAPIILMSQNRQSQKDRLTAEHDYEINLKAELEIMLLHEKLDALRETQWGELLAIQTQQSRLLADLLVRAPSPVSGDQGLTGLGGASGADAAFAAGATTGSATGATGATGPATTGAISRVTSSR
jgi:uncharacterized membrane protein